jgi:uncharacterized protein (DUF885 family)
MSFDLTSLAIDESVSKDGVWVDFLGDSRLKISSTNSNKYKAAVAKLYKENRLRLDDSNSENFRLIQEITAKALARHVLMDWQGINFLDKDGNVVENIPYSPEVGERALLKVDQLREFVSEQAGRPGLFKKEIVEEAVGN